MFARVKSDSAQNKLFEAKDIVVPMRTVTACGGLIFTQDDWRFVPAHEEKAAKDNPYLETSEKMPAPVAPKAAAKARPQPASNSDKTVRLVNRRAGEQLPPAPAAASFPSEELSE